MMPTEAVASGTRWKSIYVYLTPQILLLIPTLSEQLAYSTPDALQFFSNEKVIILYILELPLKRGKTWSVGFEPHLPIFHR